MPGACAASTSVSTPAAVELADDRLDRQHEGGRRRHVADQREPRARRHGLEIRLDRLRRLLDRERDADDRERRPVALGGRAHGVERRVVLVVAGQQLVAGLEPERRQDGRDARRRVGHEHDPLGVAVEEPGDLEPHLVEVALELPVEEPDRLRLHPVPPDALRLEDGRRAGAERAVVEERDVGLEDPRRAVVGGERHAATIADRVGLRGTRRPRQRAAPPIGPRARGQPGIDEPGGASIVGSRDPGGITCARPRPATVQLPPGRPMTSVCSSRPIQRSGVPSSTARRHSATRPGAKWGITAVPGRRPSPATPPRDVHRRSPERHRPRARPGEAGAAAQRPADGRPRGRVAEHRRDQVGVAAGEVDEVRDLERLDVLGIVGVVAGEDAGGHEADADPGPRRGGPERPLAVLDRVRRAAGARPRSGRWRRPDRASPAGTRAAASSASIAASSPATYSPPPWRAIGPGRRVARRSRRAGHAGPLGSSSMTSPSTCRGGLVDPGCGARRDVDHHPGRRPAPDEHPGQPLRPGDERREEREHDDRDHQPQHRQPQDDEDPDRVERARRPAASARAIRRRGGARRGAGRAARPRARSSRSSGISDRS